MINRTNLTLLGGAIGLSIYILATSTSTEEITEDQIKVEKKSDNVNYIKEINSDNRSKDIATDKDYSTNQDVSIVEDKPEYQNIVRDDDYMEKQQELKDKVFNQYVQPVINSNGYPLNFTSKDKTKVATIYSNAITYDPRSSTTPPPAPSIVSFSGFTAVVPSETIGEAIDTIAAVTDQTTGETEYVDLNEPTQMPNQGNSAPEEEKSKEPIVITTPPSPGQ